MADRSLPVPEGLAGMRVDAGLARLLGLSRTAAADLAEDGGVELDGARVGKSDRLVGGAWLEVRLPDAPPPVETWLSFSAMPNSSAAAAESPPPTMVVAPALVASTSACTVGSRSRSCGGRAAPTKRAVDTRPSCGTPGARRTASTPSSPSPSRSLHSASAAGVEFGVPGAIGRRARGRRT